MRMKKMPLLLAASALALAAPASGQQSAAAPAGGAQTVVANFDGDSTVQPHFQGSNAELSLISHKGGKALQAKLAARDNVYTSISFAPSAPLDLSAGQTAGIAFDLYNPGLESVQLNVDVADTKGRNATRSLLVPAGGGGTYYVEVKGADTKLDTGLRDTPQNWLIDATKATWMWGARDLDASAIASLKLVTGSLASDRTILLDNIRIITDPPVDPQYLTAIVDRFGQSTRGEAPEKIADEADLKARTLAELDGLRGKSMPGRSKWQGWADGPKLEGTGFFRTAKYKGKWTLVDPDGYLYFATGIDNIRMANTSTMTGNDFRPGAIPARRADDTTPEDSTGLNRAPDSALPGRYQAWDLRRNMFTWLPAYDEPLGAHYGYRREVHSGPLKAGETYSFYRANLERKYGNRGDESYMKDWTQVTKARMVDWGFTSFGNWLDPSFYDDPGVPYFANGWIIGDFKTVSSGDDYWAPLPDPFDPKFAERARVTAAQVAAEVKNSPWCVGIFIDNEKSWGRMESVEQQYGIVIDTMKRNAKDSPTKAVWMTMLRDKYDRIGALNAAWGTDFPSWNKVAEGVTLTGHGPAMQADYAILLERYAGEYFRVVDAALNAVLPNHLYLGSRFATWGMTPEVLRGAAKYVDVMSYNEYREIPHDGTWNILADYDKPVIIGEFHMGAVDSSLFHPGLVFATDQQDRARMYTQYMDKVIASDYFVGAHWFQYVDSPITGRAYDGENYNVGFVTVADVPYQPMVDAAKDMNATLYTDRFGAAE